jgi:aerobic-type carbon monoxide dehydrogenase small subunit (CoxS/CutS family)
MTGVALSLDVNGKATRIDVDARTTLLDLLRDMLGLTGAKRGCNMGACGACAVLLDGKAVHSCLVLAALCEGRAVTSIEGLEREGRLGTLQQAFVDHGAVQCGFCVPGMIIAATALLNEIAHPTTDEIRAGLGGNLCRCSGYVKMVEAVAAVAGS